MLREKSGFKFTVKLTMGMRAFTEEEEFVLLSHNCCCWAAAVPRIFPVFAQPAAAAAVRPVFSALSL